MKPALFVDRDGTIIVDTGYVSDPASVRLLPHAASGLARIVSVGLVPIVVSNQSGVGRGMFDMAAVDAVDRAMRDQLRRASVELAVPSYYCPHGPDDGCRCRKPGTGLFEDAIRDHGVDPERSVVVGDSPRDIEAGLAVGCSAFSIGIDVPGARSIAHLDALADVLEAERSRG
jgi:histidinol-phosphate phosphatase family protein